MWYPITTHSHGCAKHASVSNFPACKWHSHTVSPSWAAWLATARLDFSMAALWRSKWAEKCGFFYRKYIEIRWMEEILHQLMWFIPVFIGFNHPRWCRISSIHSMVIWWHVMGYSWITPQTNGMDNQLSLSLSFRTWMWMWCQWRLMMFMEMHVWLHPCSMI